MSIAILNDLILIEKRLSFNGNKPSNIKRQLYDKEIFTVNDFIDRFYQKTISSMSSVKTQKAKISKITTFCSGLNNFKQYMSIESLHKYSYLCKTLLDQYPYIAICPYCNMHINQDSIFCTYCGNKIK